jgi:hypothetical protein
VSRSVASGGGEAQELSCGAARIALTPTERPVPLAGFGPSPAFASDVNHAASGEPLDLYARAVSIRGTAEIDRGVDRLILATVDQLVVTRSFRSLVRTRLRELALASPELDMDRTEIVLTATHTHDGIGGFWRGTLPEWMSIGPFDPERTAETARRVAAAIFAAVESERPACAAAGAARLPELVESRAAGKDLVDPDLLAIALDDRDGSPVARVVVFASHPTELYGERKLSPAWPGACCEQLERLSGGVALVLQGGLGDQRPRFPPSIFEGFSEPWPNDARLRRSRAYGAAVGRAAHRALEQAVRARRSVLRLARAPLALPFPTLGACPLPVLDRLLALPVVLPYWPESTTLKVLRLGDVAFGFAPFELCAETTLRAKAQLRQVGFRDAAVVSLADDWLGYAPDIWPRPWTTSGLTSFGGTGMGYLIGSRLVEEGERIAPGR